MPRPAVNPLFRRVSGLWALLGVAAPVVVLTAGGWRNFDTPLLAATAAIAVLVAVFSLLDAEFEVAGQKIVVSPHTEPLLIAAVLLGPVPTLVAASIGILWSVRRQGPRGIAINVANTALPYGAAALVVQLVFHGAPAGALALPLAVLLASFIGEGISACGSALVLESMRRGRGLSYLRSVPGSIYFDVGLPALAAAVAAPLVAEHVWLGLSLLAALQVFSFLGFRLLASERSQHDRVQHLHNTFARYVPASVVDELVATYRHIELGGEQREITVLFCDIRNFTGWSEQLDPKTVIRELNALLSELSAAVLESGGTLDKFTGDGLMAFWGAPAEQPDHPARAVGAAREMLRKVEQHNILRELRGQPAHAIGVGIHTGRAVIGNVGHHERLDYTAIGDAVNLSARLEVATKENGCAVLMSGATHERLPSFLATACECVGELHVKGRSAGVVGWGLGMREDVGRAA